jgi:hypothetical protein
LKCILFVNTGLMLTQERFIQVILGPRLSQQLFEDRGYIGVVLHR